MNDFIFSQKMGGSKIKGLRGRVLYEFFRGDSRWSNESINDIHNFEILTYKIKHGLKLNYKIIITLIENFDII